MGVAAYAVMGRSYLTDMLDNLKIVAADRREEILCVRSEPDNLLIRNEPRGLSPKDKPDSGSKGRYFSNPENSQQSAQKKPRLSDPEWPP